MTGRSAWRGGIGLNPLGADPEACRWLLTLGWPEPEDRRSRLETFDITRREPSDLRRGDLELSVLVAEALAAPPADGRLLVFHSAVIAHLDLPGRDRFAALMRDLLTDPRLWSSGRGIGRAVSDLSKTASETRDESGVQADTGKSTRSVYVMGPSRCGRGGASPKIRDA